MFIILGIDPGTVVTGYGVLSYSEEEVLCKDYGVIEAPRKASLQKRVGFINKNLEKLYKLHKPSHTAVEKIFFGKNPEVAFKLGHIFALCLLHSQNNGSEFFEYPARFVKKSVTFSGRASKELVCQFVKNSLSLEGEESYLDATDALAVALCHSREWKKSQIQKKNRECVL